MGCTTQAQGAISTNQLFRKRPVYSGRFSIRHNSQLTSKMELYTEGIFRDL